MPSFDLHFDSDDITQADERHVLIPASNEPANRGVECEADTDQIFSLDNIITHLDTSLTPTKLQPSSYKSPKEIFTPAAYVRKVLKGGLNDDDMKVGRGARIYVTLWGKKHKQMFKNVNKKETIVADFVFAEAGGRGADAKEFDS